MPLRSAQRAVASVAPDAAGVQRYVAENFFFVYGATPVGSPPVTEDYPLHAGTEVTKSQDDQVREFGGVSLRCGLFYGHSVGSTDYLAGLVRRRRAPVIRGARNRYSYVHIDDAARGVIAAVENGTPERRTTSLMTCRPDRTK